MTKRSSFTRQTVYKTYIEIKKKKNSCVVVFFVIDKYIIVSSLPFETKQPWDWAKHGRSLEKRSSSYILYYYTYTIYSSTVIVLCQTWQGGLQIRWHDMANRSNMYSFLFFTSKDPPVQNICLLLFGCSPDSVRVWTTVSVVSQSLMIDHITAFTRRAEQLVCVLALRLVGALSTHS